jgi:hypothetical protein
MTKPGVERSRFRAVCVCGVAIVLLSAGSKEQEPRPLTEQEIHSMDTPLRPGEVGRHPYKCADGSRILVDFKNSGLTLEYRARKADRPVVLTAPSQGLQFFGEHTTAIIRERNLILEEDGSIRTCTPEGAD